MENKMDKDKYICTHLGDDYEKFNGAVVPPIYENSLFIFEKYEDLIKGIENERDYYVYTRGTNPTVEILEKKLAALERGEACKVFSSGMAAISSALISNLKQGDHILFVNVVYGPALEYAKFLNRFGITYSISLDTDMESINSKIRENTKVIYVESPGTMIFKLVDLRKLSHLAKSNEIITMIDNTWSTPLYQKPLELGIDISIHSCTKYIGGHSDVIAGAVISTTKIIDKIFHSAYLLHGGAIGPFEAWLLIRGLRTLPLRLKQQYDSALKIAEFLQNHPKVEKVNYPGLVSSEDHKLSKEQMSGYTGLLSFQLKSNKFEDLLNVINSCKIFRIGVSWGGYESLILSEYRGNNLEHLKETNVSTSLIRLSIGFEPIELLINDISNALTKI